MYLIPLYSPSWLPRRKKYFFFYVMGDEVFTSTYSYCSMDVHFRKKKEKKRDLESKLNTLFIPLN